MATCRRKPSGRPRPHAGRRPFDQYRQEVRRVISWKQGSDDLCPRYREATWNGRYCRNGHTHFHDGRSMGKNPEGQYGSA